VSKDHAALDQALNPAKVDSLRSTLSRTWQVDEAPCFANLLRAIDEADRQSSSQADKKSCG
jgi:hypothetical protein